MRYVGTSKRAALGLALAVVVGCNDTVEPGTNVDLDAQEVITAVETLVLPVWASQSADTALVEAASYLIAQGAVLDRAPASNALAGVGIRLIRSVASVELPPELLGKTLVYDAAQQQWMVDPDRTDAPADAIRVVWYRRDRGFLVLPLVEQGYVDLTDQDDAGDLSLLGIRIVDTTGSDEILLADFTRGSRITEDGSQRTEHVEAAGFYRSPGFTNDVTFDLTSTVVDNGTAGRESTLDMALSAPTAGLGYDFAFSSTEVGTEILDGDFLVTVDDRGVVTVLNLVVPGTGGADFSGTISRAGNVVAQMAFAGQRFSFTTPQGEPIESGQAAELAVLVQTMLLGGYDVLYSLPFFVG